MSVLVSINCITYNHENYIAGAIESFLMQKTNFKFEVLIHDDASTDDTAEIIRKYHEQFPDIIKPIYQIENQYSKGKHIDGSINLPRALGKFIAICEGDDYWTNPYKLQKQVDYMLNHPECSLCLHAASTVDASSGIQVGSVSSFKENRIVTTEEVISRGGAIFATNSVMYVRELMDNPPDFYLKAKVGDFPLYMALADQGAVYYMNENMSAHRIKVPGSWTERNTTGQNANKKIAMNCDNDIWILENFNDYTKGKYSSVVEKELTKRYLRRMILLNEYEKIDKIDFLKKLFELTLKEQMRMGSLLFFPTVHKRLHNLKMKFNQKKIKNKQD